jgi:hypothetical protein
MNARLLLLMLLMSAPAGSAGLAQAPARPVTQASPGVPSGRARRSPRPAPATTNTSRIQARAVSPGAWLAARTVRLSAAPS